MKKNTIFLIFLLMSLIPGCLTTITEDDVTTFEVINMTTFVFNSLRIRETGETNWLQTRNGEYGLGDHSFYFYTPLNAKTRYDIQLRTANDISATKSNVLIAENGIITFNYSDFDDDTSNEISTIHILNETGVDFSQILIGETGSSSWLLYRTIPILNENTITISDISPPFLRTKRYDIQILQLPYGTITATKQNIILSQNGVIRIEKTDLD